jgi:uncharacterized protein (DUF305 family)
MGGIAANAAAQGPGRGRTAAFEPDYLEFVIDHHYAALRMTELAAGTDATRDAAISPSEGTSPTPQTARTAAKAQLDEIKSMARQENRGQREEILHAQSMLRHWYGISYQPKLTTSGQQAIATLEGTASGAAFDQAFMRTMSSHHFQVLGPTMQCLTGADVAHVELERYCGGIAESQVRSIDEMRHMLCDKYSDCDFQPFIVTSLHQNGM